LEEILETLLKVSNMCINISSALLVFCMAWRMVFEHDHELSLTFANQKGRSASSISSAVNVCSCNTESSAGLSIAISGNQISSGRYDKKTVNSVAFTVFPIQMIKEGWNIIILIAADRAPSKVIQRIRLHNGKRQIYKK
jgi:hypothetical protein